MLFFCVCHANVLITDIAKQKVDHAFEVGIAKAENDLYLNFRLSKASKCILLDSIDVSKVRAKYNLAEKDSKSLPLLIKNMVSEMITQSTLKSYLPVENQLLALCKLCFIPFYI